MEAFGVIRRVQKSEATDGTHVRMKMIECEKWDLVRSRLVSMEINQHERCDVFAGTLALNIFSTWHSSTQTWTKLFKHTRPRKQSQIAVSCGCY